MLKDKLIEGSGSFIPKASFRDIPVGARAYLIKARQEPARMDSDVSQPANTFVGIPVEESLLSEIREANSLSTNYGALYFPKFRIEGLDKSSKGLVGEVEGAYIFRGLLPTNNLKWEMKLRGYLLENEEVIFGSPEDFIGINLREYDASIEEMTEEAKHILRKAEPSFRLSTAVHFAGSQQGGFPASVRR